MEYANDNEFIELIEEYNYRYHLMHYMYLRLAPSIDMKISQYERVLKINNLYQEHYNEEYNSKLLDNCEIPIYNDNIFYSL